MTGAIAAPLALVQGEAQRQCGWEVRAVSESPQRDGEVPHGVLLARRREGEYPLEGRPWLTAEYAVRPRQGVVLFEQGHYDLTREEAVGDYADRLR